MINLRYRFLEAGSQHSWKSCCNLESTIIIEMFLFSDVGRCTGFNSVSVFSWDVDLSVYRYDYSDKYCFADGMQGAGVRTVIHPGWMVLITF